jgi:hypothetical protein
MSAKHLKKEYLDTFNKSITSITEFFDNANVGLFVNWVEDGQTYRAEIFRGNAFALRGQINKWACENLDEIGDGYQNDSEDKQ